MHLYAETIHVLSNHVLSNHVLSNPEVLYFVQKLADSGAPVAETDGLSVHPTIPLLFNRRTCGSSQIEALRSAP